MFLPDHSAPPFDFDFEHENPVTYILNYTCISNISQQNPHKKSLVQLN